MAKIFTEIELDKTRRMRFGYKIIKELDKQSKERSGMSEIEALEYMIYMSLKEDDPELKLEQIEDILDCADITYIKEKLTETIERDMPGLTNISMGEETKNAQITTEILNP